MLFASLLVLNIAINAHSHLKNIIKLAHRGTCIFEVVWLVFLLLLRGSETNIVLNSLTYLQFFDASMLNSQARMLSFFFPLLTSLLKVENGMSSFEWSTRSPKASV